MMKISALVLTLLISLTAKGQPAGDIDSCSTGNELYSSFRYAQALPFLKTCCSQSGDTDCLKKIAYSNYKLGRFAEAKENYLFILEEDSADLQSMNLLAGIFSAEGRTTKAMEIYQRLLSLDSTNSIYHKQLASLALKRDDFPKAIIHFTKALQLNPDDIFALTELAALYQKVNFAEQTSALVQQGLAMDSTNARLLLIQGKLHYSLKDYAQTLKSLENLMKVTGDTSVFVLKLAGVSNFHLENYETSIQLLEKAVRLRQGLESVHYYLGLAYRAMGNHSRSIEHFDLAIKEGISDNIGTYYTNLAVSLEEQGDFAEAIRAYKAAYRNSGDQVLLYHLARNYDAYYKDKKTALEYYQRYLAQNDTNHEEFTDYSEHRISELKKVMHFKLDTLE